MKSPVTLIPPLAVAGAFFYLAWASLSSPGVSSNGLLITEIMYAPLPASTEEGEAGLTSDDFEFIEIHNARNEALPLMDLKLEGQVQFDFNTLGIDFLMADEHLVLAANPEAYQRRYPDDPAPAGRFTGHLPDEGTLSIVNGEGTLLLDFHYARGNGWPKTPAGLGFSLTLKNPTLETDHRLPASWRASERPGGTPGLADTEADQDSVVINEIFARSKSLNTYYRTTSYPANAAQSPSGYLRQYVADMKTDPYNFTFLHLLGPDTTGHGWGWGGSFQKSAIEGVDGELGAIFDLIDNDPRLRGRTAIILTADHGGGGEVINNHLDPLFPVNFTIHFHVWGPGVPPGADLYELNLETRTRPGAENNPPYQADSSLMPIRNGEVGNLALQMLGLQAIPGSWINSGQNLNVGDGGDGIEYVIAISADGLRPKEIQDMGPDLLPNIHRLRREGAFTDEARTDTTKTNTNPNHTSMVTSLGVADAPDLGRGHRVTFNTDPGSINIHNLHTSYLFSVFDVCQFFGKSTAFYSNKSKLDFLARSYGAIGGDSVEIYNPTDEEINIGGWFLTDDPAQPDKFVIEPDTFVPARGYFVLSEDNGWRSSQRPFEAKTLFGSAFSIDPAGGELHLFAADEDGNLTGYDHGIAFNRIGSGLIPQDQAIGRQVTATGDGFAILANPTPGTENSSQAVSPLIVTEIFNGTTEQPGYIELKNISNTNLTISTNWSLAGSIDYLFGPEPLLLTPGEIILVPIGAASAETFRSHYGLPAWMEILTPAPGALDTEGHLRLGIEGTAGSGDFLTVDEVQFRQNAAWPLLGSGRSIERRRARDFGNDPANWAEGETGGTPGTHLRGTFALWQTSHFTEEELADPSVSGLSADPDGDRMQNFFEYAFATDPKDRLSTHEPILE
ncbi:MAG: alkaline phosphatase family protein, partial [Verrucomicrobiota bacterium]